jgi:hypothetical protein
VCFPSLSSPLPLHGRGVLPQPGCPSTGLGHSSTGQTNSMLAHREPSHSCPPGCPSSLRLAGGAALGSRRRRLRLYVYAFAYAFWRSHSWPANFAECPAPPRIGFASACGRHGPSGGRGREAALVCPLGMPTVPLRVIVWSDRHVTHVIGPPCDACDRVAM